MAWSVVSRPCLQQRHTQVHYGVGETRDGRELILNIRCQERGLPFLSPPLPNSLSSSGTHETMATQKGFGGGPLGLCDHEESLLGVLA